MNPIPITGSVNEKGVFTAKNKFNPTTEPASHKWQADKHPQLLTYTPSNVLVTDEEHVEVVKAHRIEHTKVWSVINDDEYEFYENTNVKLQPCYITIPPTEKKSLAEEVGRDKNMPDIANYIYSKVPTPEDIEWAKGKVHEIKSSIPEAQPKSYVLGFNNKMYKIAKPVKNNGLKRDIIELVRNLANPDDDCMLSDFLHALQFVLNKHSFPIPEAQPLKGVKTAEADKEYYSNGYQPLFNLMADNGQIMVQDELYEIINCVRLMDKYQKSDCVEVKGYVIKSRISELKEMQIQASDDYIFCEKIEYAIKELQSLTNTQFATDAGGGKEFLGYSDNNSLKVGETSFTKVQDGWVEIVTKNECCCLSPEEVQAFNKFTSSPSTHSSSEIVIDTEKAIEALRYAAIYFKVELEEDKNLSGAYECLCKIESVLGYQVKAGHDPL